VCTL
jgi:hypothetical protein